MARQYHKNPRQITRDQMAKLEATLAELGDLSGIVHDLNSDEIIGGNQRSRVFDINDCDVELVQVNDEPDAQGTVAHGFVLWEGNKYAYRQVRWTERQAEKANVVANKAGGNWDFDVLANEFEIDDLLDWGFEAFELGLDEDDPPGAGEDTEPQTDRADELRQKWGVKLGQLWRLPSAHGDNEHRLICGDCTDADVVARVMAGERAQICFTSPPYADQREYTQDGDLSPEHLASFLTAASSIVDIFAVNLGIKREEGEIITYWDAYIIQASTDGLKCLAWNVWSRHGFGGSIGNMSAMFPIEHEFIFVFGKAKVGTNPIVPNKTSGASFTGTTRGKNGTMGKKRDSTVRPMRELGSVYVSDVARGEKDHPAMFPVKLPEAYIAACSAESGIIYEPFAGSGTTIIAAENLQRQCRAIEISPAYCGVILERYHDHTGLTPELIDRGESEN